jgi:hypothetical protein
MYNDTSHSVGLLWMNERLVAEASHNIDKRQTSALSVGFEPSIPESDWLRILALDRSATGTGHHIRIGKYNFVRYERGVMQHAWKS